MNRGENWDPKKELGIIRYFLFKLGKEVRVKTPPEWVREAHIQQYGHLSGTYKDIYFGDSLVYRITYDGHKARVVKTTVQIKK